MGSLIQNSSIARPPRCSLPLRPEPESQTNDEHDPSRCPRGRCNRRAGTGGATRAAATFSLPIHVRLHVKGGGTFRVLAYTSIHDASRSGLGAGAVCRSGPIEAVTGLLKSPGPRMASSIAAGLPFPALACIQESGSDCSPNVGDYVTRRELCSIPHARLRLKYLQQGPASNKSKSTRLV